HHELSGKRQEAHTRLKLHDGVVGAGDLERAEETGQVSDGGEVLESSKLQARRSNLLAGTTGKLFGDVTVEGGVIVEDIADGATRRQRVPLHVLRSVKRKAASAAGWKLEMVDHLGLAGHGVYTEVVKAAIGRVDGKCGRSLPLELSEIDVALYLRLM